MFIEQLLQWQVNYSGTGKGAARQRTMKVRKHTNGRLDLHAELYHRTKVEALRAEGERLRHELRRRGVDPASILTEARHSQQAQTRN